MISKIIIAGKGGSGKDFLRKKLELRGFDFCVSYTSRPKRNNEEEGKDYYYVSKDYFEKNKEEFYEIDEFNGWLYGHKKEDFHNSNLMIMTPSGVKNILPEDREKCFIVFVDPPINVIRERLIKRKDADSAERRIKSDELDFDGFSDYDLRITNPDF